MEKYVLEALFQMNAANQGLDRMRKRYKPMLDFPGLTTLPENWMPEGTKPKPGEPMVNSCWGTYNHGWSGGPLTILSQKVCGIEPTSPGFKTFRIRPQLGYLKEASCTIESVSGKITGSIQKKGEADKKISTLIPEGCTAEVVFPNGKTKKLEQGFALCIKGIRK